MGTGRHSPPAFGALLRWRRRAAGLTQEQLAERADISARAVSDLERGVNLQPRLGTAQLLANGLGLAGDDRDAFLAAARPTALATGRRGRDGSAGRIRLPAPPTPLMGRDRECASLAALLRSEAVRLVTLTGAGGIGKTRLAGAVAAEIEQDFGDGAVVVDLAPLTDHRLMLSTIAAAFGVQETSDQSLWDALVGRIGNRHLLLVLDTFERVTDAALDVAELLVECASLTILVTSREALRLRAERRFPVPPLPTPDDHELAAPHIETLAAIPSVALFVDRAQAVRPDFTLTTETAAPAAAICRRLEGWPLAIELAAARIDAMTAHDLARSLDQGLAALADGPRDLPERQRTPWATLAWSYDLLDPTEQRLLRQLSVFAGGFAVDAAEAVAEVEPNGTTSLAARLAALADAHLAQIDTRADGATRYRLPDIVREFAAELAHDAGDAEPARARHAAYYRDAAEAEDAALSGPSQRQSLDRIEIEHDNFRSAIGWALTCRDAETALRLTAALWSFWETRGYLTEGRTWLERALDLGEQAPAPLRAKALTAAAGLADALGDYDRARTLYEQAIPIWRAAGDRKGLARTLNNLGIVADTVGNYERAATLYDEALALHRQDGHTASIPIVLNNLGALAFVRGDYAGAAALHEESLTLRQQAGDKQGVAASLTNVAAAVSALGDEDRSKLLLEEALGLYRSLGDLAGIASALLNLGVLAHWGDDLARATRHYEEALSLRRRLDDVYMIAVILHHLAAVAKQKGDFRHAYDLYRESLALRQDIGDRVGIAGSLLGFADIAAAHGDAERAAGLIGAAEAVFDAAGYALPPRARDELARDIAKLRDRLGEAAYMAAVERGRSRTLETAISEATAIQFGGVRVAGNRRDERPSPAP